MKQNPAATSTTSAAALRIRENQRRSRARRKEYIQHLEERLQAYEKFGVTASKEIQQAGRKVAAENVLLRELLRRRGVPDEDVEEFLKSANDLPSISKRDRYCLSDCSQLTLGTNNPLKELDIPVTQYRLAKTTAAENHTILDDQDLARAKESLETTGSPRVLSASIISEPKQRDFDRDQEGRGQSTSCEIAARIIAGMRHNNTDIDIRDVRAELGCGPGEQNCKVHNMSIFEILDK